MDPKKVKAITEWPRPIDGKGIQRFMGAANFHKDFSLEFAKLSAPLDECRNMTHIEWTPTRIQAFEAIKQLFAKGILLKHIDWKKDIYLTTDASLFGIGAWLGQKNEEGNIEPIVCVLKKLTPTQQRWSLMT